MHGACNVTLGVRQGPSSPSVALGARSIDEGHLHVFKGAAWHHRTVIPRGVLNVSASLILHLQHPLIPSPMPSLPHCQSACTCMRHEHTFLFHEVRSATVQAGLFH